MLNTFSFCQYGDVEIKNVMIDVDGTNLVDGVQITFEDDEFDTIEIVGHIDLNELEADDVEKLIEDNLKKVW